MTSGNPEQGLSGSQMKRLQTALKNRGYDVGQHRRHPWIRHTQGRTKRTDPPQVPADAWPTPALLSKLEGDQQMSLKLSAATMVANARARIEEIETRRRHRHGR